MPPIAEGLLPGIADQRRPTNLETNHGGCQIFDEQRRGGVVAGRGEGFNLSYVKAFSRPCSQQVDVLLSSTLLYLTCLVVR